MDDSSYLIIKDEKVEENDSKSVNSFNSISVVKRKKKARSKYENSEFKESEMPH